MTAFFTRWVKQKIRCRVNKFGEIIEVIEIIDEEIESDDYQSI